MAIHFQERCNIPIQSLGRDRRPPSYFPLRGLYGRPIPFIILALYEVSVPISHCA